MSFTWIYLSFFLPETLVNPRSRNVEKISENPKLSFELENSHLD